MFQSNFSEYPSPFVTKNTPFCINMKRTKSLLNQSYISYISIITIFFLECQELKRLNLTDLD